MFTIGFDVNVDLIMVSNAPPTFLTSDYSGTEGHVMTLSEGFCTFASKESEQ